MYGSLQFADVLNALLGRVPADLPAVADGWRAVKLLGVPYPGLISGEGSTPGLVFADLSDVEWYVLDQFEDSLYDLTLLTLYYRQPPVWAYTSPPGSDIVTDRAWDIDEFRARHLDSYVSRCIAWRAQLADHDGTVTVGAGEE